MVQNKTLKTGDKDKLTWEMIGNPTPTFTWNTTKSDVDLSGKIGRVLELDNRNRSDGDHETITCTGTVDYKGQSMCVANFKANRMLGLVLIGLYKNKSGIVPL